jgi:hypothetical protein
MGRFMIWGLVGLATLFAGLAWAQRLPSPRRPAPTLFRAWASQGPSVHPFWVGGGGVSPGTITFTSANPDGSTAGSGATTVRFFTLISGGFTIYAKAQAANFTGCDNPPAGAVTVACSGATGVTCAAPAPLSNTGNGTTIATGSGTHLPASFTVTYAFQDAWNYQVSSGCSLNVQYTATEP